MDGLPTTGPPGKSPEAENLKFINSFTNNSFHVYVYVYVYDRNINNLRYADDTTLMAESEELNSLLMKVKEESEKLGLNSTFRKL